MRIETYRGISFRLQLTETGRRRRRFAVCIDMPPTDICFTAVNRDLGNMAESVLAREQRMTTGDERFDREVILATDSRYLPAASFFQSQDYRAALMQLLGYSGFTEIERTATSVTATAEFQDRSDRPDLKRIVDVGIPQLARLAGLAATYPGPFGAGESEAAAMVHRLESFLDRKSPHGAALTGFLGALAPLAYFHIGAWRWGLESAIVYYTLACGVVWISAPNDEILVGALFPAAAWKAYAACELRNRLVSMDGKLGAADFNSFRNAGFAMSDLLLGSCMALSAGIAFLGVWRSMPDAFGDWNHFMAAMLLYLLLAMPSVWLTELAAGYVLIRFSAVSDGDNPFLGEQRRRWRRHGAKEGDTKAISRLVPNAREAMRAVFLVLAVPLSIFVLALGQ